MEMKQISLLHLIYSRRTIRKFKKSTISENILKMIIEAGQRAPCYFQTYSIIWVRDHEKIREIAEACEDELTKSMLLNSAAVLLLCIDFNRFRAMLDSLGHNHIMKLDKYPIESVYAVFEAGLVAENICLAAESLGYGTALVSHALLSFQTVASLFNFPNGVVPLIFICIGERGENPPPRPRWPMQVVFHKDMYNPVTREDIENYLEAANRAYSTESYLRKYANWHGDYREYLIERTEVSKDVKKLYDVLSAFLKKNGLRI